MQPFISVIICSHNPKVDYIRKAISALKIQSLPKNLWELLLVDNASDRVISSEIDLSWHSQARHIREEQLGLTPARLRGIKEATSETLVFVDDDNILDSDYLEVALKISKDYTIIGAWGGQIRPEFEEPPPEWTKPLLPYLAIREFQRDSWSNVLQNNETIPCGAGLCVRKIVADQYAKLISHDSRRMNMDRKGKLLSSCGDTDIALTACHMGLGTGQFTSLKMTHIMPSSRLKEDYLLRMIKGTHYSGTILNYLWYQKIPQLSWRSSKIYSLYLRWRFGSRTCHFHEASQQGIRLALKEIANWENVANLNTDLSS
ncbi:glycosyltransferase [Nostoc sp. FACHB-110]|uniref:glycosyltransferase n=1 Tax=Nostoc sp. FACHB-110 TaxID=2692834 RepID=UPI001682EC6C|nr:glycosyltransferase [Nostoc sp. FACHB-110]MBD2437152.1 glycosyltransferase family 2 protein [Nostoc sp. FACHB-110]